MFYNQHYVVIMTRKPLKHISFVERHVLKIDYRTDKLGNSFYCVDWGTDYVCFSKMASVIDFLNTNFNRNPQKFPL